MRTQALPRVPLRILLIFVLSGAAGLIDEIVWSRQLVLVFGNTTQAVSAILTGFFGGMAIGSLIGGRVADRVRSPLRLYGIIELILVLVVLATPVTFRLIDDAYRAVYPALEGSPQVLALVRLALSVVALAPATVMMGATLPTLTRYLTRDGHLSAAFGQLYAANTIGAIVGTLVAGLILIEVLGLTGALVVGAGCSGVAGLAALGLSRGKRRATLHDPLPAEAPPPAEPADRLLDAVHPSAVGVALVVAFVSGLTSLGYQVLWTRLLASGTGNTTYVFTVILALFLIGLAIGALLFHFIRPRLRDPIRLLAGAQVLVAVIVLLGLVGVIERPQVSRPDDFGEVVLALLGVAIPVVLLATIVLGLTFPAASALLAADSRRTGRSAGTFLAVNTLGAITGSFVVPFALIPTLGSPRALLLLALINAVTGAALALRASRVSRGTPGPGRFAMPLAAAGVAVVLVVVAAIPGALVQPNEARIRSFGGTVFAATEDEIATVEAGQRYATPELWVAGTSMTLLTVDAKLMPVLPLIARPDSRDALVVAFGMGTAFRTALIAGLQTDVVELVPSVPDMFGYYYPVDAAAVLANPNGRVIIADGRNHLELTDHRYDIIVTDPPPPLESSGASVISSLEYYQAGHDHLTANGVMMQWIPWGQTVDEYRAHVRSFVSVFPNVTIVFGAGGFGSYLLGSNAPIELPAEAIREVLLRPGILEDISSAYDSPAHDVDAWIAKIAEMSWISGPDVVAFAGEGPMVTDDRPVSEYFLLRRWIGDGTPRAGPSTVRKLAPGG